MTVLNEKLDFEPDNEGENQILRDVNKWLLVCETVSLDREQSI